MGVLNVTPDSFSDGGLYATVDAAVARGLDLMAAGADVVDVGGESSRPGAEPVPVDVELERVVPVVEALAAAARSDGRGVRVSVDTVKPEVATAALAAGADPAERHLRLAATRWRPPRAPGGWPCTCRAGPAPCRTTRSTPTWSSEVPPSCWSGPSWRSGGRGGRGLDRPRHRVRQDGVPQPVAPAAPRDPGGGRGRRRLRRGPGRDQPQALPRRPGRRARCGAARLRWPTGPRDRWPPRLQPWWRAWAWCGSTTWRPRCR